jgi:hypothetical protein
MLDSVPDFVEFVMLFNALIPPPQTVGKKTDTQFVSEKAKSICSMAFCKDIGNLVLCGDMLNLNIMINHLLPDEMVVNFDVFRA